MLLHPQVKISLCIGIVIIAVLSLLAGVTWLAAILHEEETRWRGRW